MKSRLQRSIEYIKGYCDKHECCDSCKLNDIKAETCMLKRCPMEWEYNEQKIDALKGKGE